MKIRSEEVPGVELMERILTAHRREQAKTCDRLAICLLQKRGIPPSAEAIRRLNETSEDPLRLHDLHRRWVLAYMQVACERDLDPVTVVERQETREEATRRMFTRNDFILHEIGEAIAKRYAIADTQAASQASTQLLHLPPGEAAARSTQVFEEVRRALARGIALDVAPIERFYVQEADRIYGPALPQPS